MLGLLGSIAGLIVTYLILNVMRGILMIQVEQDNSNNASDALPPTLPHELANIYRSEFGKNFLYTLTICEILE